MLDLEVIPERSLGCENCQFKLGMPIIQAVHILQKQCRNISYVEVIYVENDPLVGDLILRLPNEAIRLLFDSVSQRLKMIEVYDTSKLTLRYGGNVFSSAEVVASREQIDATFGATRPPEFDPTVQAFLLTFRGLSFSFPVTSSSSSSSSSSTAAERASPQFSNRNLTTASRMFIFSGNNLSDAKDMELPWHCLNDGVYSNGLDVVRENATTVGIQVHLQYEGLEGGPSGPSRIKHDVRTVCFGSTVQDVLSLLGSPIKVFYKSEDKMKIHAPPDQHHNRCNERSDYFFNYFTLGIDILFDAVTQRAKKFVLHTNYPGHYDFNLYYRCHFKIPLAKSSFADDLGQNHTCLLDQTEPLIVTAFSKWEEIQAFVMTSESLPIVLNRSSSVNATNPFGPTYCYGYQDMIFEVMPHGYIASVTLYQTKQ